MKYRMFILILAATLGTGFLIESISGQALVTGGNAQQTRDKCGFVKAMIFIQGGGSQTIVSCFNSYLSGDAATTTPCGFSLRESFGFGSNHSEYREVNFGFRVDDRFVNTFTPNGRVSDARYGYGVVTETTNPNVLSITTEEYSDCTIFVY